jgi:DNA polymerase (family 10)
MTSMPTSGAKEGGRERIAKRTGIRRDANAEAATLLDRIGNLLALEGESQFRVRAYQEAASQIRGMKEDISNLWREGQLTSISGVGPSIASKLDDWLRTGRSSYLDELQRAMPAGIERLLDVPGVGPVRARVLAERLSITSPEELANAARAHRLREIRGFGPRLEESIAVEAMRWAQRERRILLGTSWPVASRMIESFRSVRGSDQVSAAGSLRRMRETVGDIDILAAADNTSEATTTFTQLPDVREILAIGPTKATVLVEGSLQIDLRVVLPNAWGAALQAFTGSKQHNIALRERAIERGLRINEYGVYEDRTGRRLGGEQEVDVYQAVGLEWIPPELREDRGEIQAAANHKLPVLLERSDLRGDLHVHSNWSDGKATIEQMALAAREAGLHYIAITDHSPGLTVARGLSPERLRQQRREIDDANQRVAPFRILQGVEVDVHPDGSLDLPNDILEGLDYVSASVHSHFRLSRDAMTERIVKALRNPRVMTLNHPTGRLIDRRPGYDVDLDRVFRVASQQGVAIEINSQPDRLDLNDVLARRAMEMGCTLVVNSDSHGPAGFDNLRYGVAMARRGWLTCHNVLNTLDITALTAHLRSASRKAA